MKFSIYQRHFCLYSLGTGNFQLSDHSNEASEYGASKQKTDSMDNKETTYLAIGIITVILLILITSFLIYYFKIKARNNENVAS